jgi:hypothetical protein
MPRQQQRVLLGLYTAALLYCPDCDGFALPGWHITTSKLSRAAAVHSRWAENRRITFVFQQADDSEFLADEMIDADVSYTKSKHATSKPYTLNKTTFSTNTDSLYLH